MNETIVVDGSNVAYVERSRAGDPKIENVTAVVERLKERGFDPIVIVHASLRHEIDDPERLEVLLDDQTVRQAPAETDADYFVLETADREDARVVSNDEYDAYRDEYPWIADRRVPLMIIDGEVELYDEQLD